ncbi:TPA: hypothetical protein N0F65_004790 [Lagenidium giganteum]|uniref:Uncharacterized protein n=1 Tax=Lagenidium giganteum TaxID=4803 RepID=A0AAV2Z8M0_9STRA|nr:TPA: hypothetical protein N0F65_004790 [Lagenidium giganteum]
MGSGFSVTLGASPAGSVYRYGHVGSATSTVEATRNGPTWIGKTLDMPPKPFSLENYFTLSSVLGTGMLGKVRLVQHKKSKKFFALKSMRKKDVLDQNMLRHLESERLAMTTLTKLRHPFMAVYFGSFQTSTHVHFLLEYVPGGELFRRLHQVGHFSNDEAMFYATELLLFIDFCHQHNYMYRDLKPENILLDARGHIRVVDFGFVKSFEDPEERCTTSVGTPQYLAPEQLTQSKDKRNYTRIVDWWAFACVVFEMVAGKTPFYHSKNDSTFELYTRIVKGQISWPHGMHVNLKDLLKKMLNPDVSKRLCDPLGIKQHAWFQQVDWDEVYHSDIEPPYVPRVLAEGDRSCFDEYPESSEEVKPSRDNFEREFRNF